jgi:hypothetical protein
MLPFIVLVSSVILAVPQPQAVVAKDLDLGTVFMVSSTGAPDRGRAEIISDVVVRVTDSKSVQSFGITNETGVLAMPLPPGRYCWDAFSKTGKALRMNRPPEDRCFQVRRNEIREVGIGLGVSPELL